MTVSEKSQMSTTSNVVLIVAIKALIWPGEITMKITSFLFSMIWALLMKRPNYQLIFIKAKEEGGFMLIFAKIRTKHNE